jgi:flagellar motor switch protein FliM
MVVLEANAEPLFWCRLGQADGHYTIRVEAAVEPTLDLDADLLR